MHLVTDKVHHKLSSMHINDISDSLYREAWTVQPAEAVNHLRFLFHSQTSRGHFTIAIWRNGKRVSMLWLGDTIHLRSAQHGMEFDSLFVTSNAWIMPIAHRTIAGVPVHGYKNNKYRGFKSLEEAKAYMQNNNVSDYALVGHPEHLSSNGKSSILYYSKWSWNRDL